MTLSCEATYAAWRTFAKPPSSWGQTPFFSGKDYSWQNWAAEYLSFLSLLFLLFDEPQRSHIASRKESLCRLDYMQLPRALTHSDLLDCLFFLVKFPSCSPKTHSFISGYKALPCASIKHFLQDKDGDWLNCVTLFHSYSSCFSCLSSIPDNHVSFGVSLLLAVHFF